MRRFAIVVIALTLFSSCGKRFNAQNTSDVYSFSAPSVAKIERLEGGSGSGFFVINGDGVEVVVTNAHVCGLPGTGLRVHPDALGKPFLSHVLRISYRYDLCTLSVPKGELHPALTVASNPAPFGSRVYAVGHPAGLPLSVTEGLVIGTMKENIGYPKEFCRGGLGEMVQDPFSGEFCGRSMEGQIITALVIPGNSGGPLLNARGEVVGVVFATSPLGGDALPLRSLQRFLAAK